MFKGHPEAALRWSKTHLLMMLHANFPQWQIDEHLYFHNGMLAMLEYLGYEVTEKEVNGVPVFTISKENEK